MLINLTLNNHKETIVIKIQMKKKKINFIIKMKIIINMRDIMMMILSIKKMKMKCMIDPILIMKKILKIKKLRMQE